MARVVDMLDRIPMADRDTKGDLYEYLLSKLSTAGQNGQFRTPRHIIKLMTELVAPTPQDIIWLKPTAKQTKPFGLGRGGDWLAGLDRIGGGRRGWIGVGGGGVKTHG